MTRRAWRRTARSLRVAVCVLSTLGQAQARAPGAGQKAPSLLGELGAPASELLLARDAPLERLSGFLRL